MSYSLSVCVELGDAISTSEDRNVIFKWVPQSFSILECCPGESIIDDCDFKTRVTILGRRIWIVGNSRAEFGNTDVIFVEISVLLLVSGWEEYELEGETYFE